MNCLLFAKEIHKVIQSNYVVRLEEDPIRSSVIMYVLCKHGMLLLKSFVIIVIMY